MLKVNRKPNIHAKTSYCLAQIIASRKAVPSASDRKSIRSAEGIRSAQLWSTEGASVADRLILLEPRYCVSLYPANCGASVIGINTYEQDQCRPEADLIPNPKETHYATA